MKKAQAPQAQVYVLGTQYMVTMADGVHVVGKDKRCHTCPDEGTVCPAVYAVADYIKAGGRRAPDVLPAAPSRPRQMAACPICGAPVKRDTVLDNARRGPGWRCTEGGYAHLYLSRYPNAQKWFCGEGAQRHAMLLPDEPPAVQLRLPEPKIIPFERPTSAQHKQAA